MTEKEINKKTINIWADIVLDHLHILEKGPRTFDKIQAFLTHAETAVWQLKDLYDTAITPDLKTTIRNLAASIRHHMKQVKEGK